MAVNCLVIEPISKTVSFFAATRRSRFADPYAARFTTRPSRTTTSCAAGRCSSRIFF
jgi:hypothetical protein